jgi:hypothetical protein
MPIKVKGGIIKKIIKGDGKLRKIIKDEGKGPRKVIKTHKIRKPRF